MEKYILKDMIVGEILEGNYDTIKKEKNVYILKESGE